MPGRKGSGICEEYYAQSYQGSRGNKIAASPIRRHSALGTRQYGKWS